ncbi:NAD(P)H-quinone oxidoreductase subunit U, chloroplastic isoform X2 [Prosopis cineraria]|uniref:NAD(P)H-quinone oxidoreductase subunit U, chloroplastic isoform X2 n=1 Tax=Prosopis cineraria TaxID=364024 RepID=UPI0024105D1E|nr:NAD(P)H-quinone oxidoreductase subunit U, chloroplastic isoform X2 [Prosopis cineraria]
MAVLSTTATVSIPGNNVHTTQETKFGSSIFVGFRAKPRRFCIRCSVASDSSPDATATQSDSETAIEVPEESSSLISALNVERALRGIPITDVDHYGRLGIPRGSSYEKVAVAYDSKVEELKNEGLEEDELNKKLEHLKVILSSKEERRMYDWSLARSENTDQYVWPFEVDITQTPQGTPPLQEPEEDGPTRVVGYFLLGWVLISFVLSIALS